MKKKIIVVELTIVFVVILLLSLGCGFNLSATNNSNTLDLSSLRKTYISGDNSNDSAYSETTETKKENLFFEPVTSLSVSSTSENAIHNPIYDEEKGVYVIALSSISDFTVNLKTKNVTEGDGLGNNYELSYDSFGNTQTGDKTPRITGTGNKVFTGVIGTGALVVQKSYDGKNYDQLELEKYNNGFYVTDYLRSFSGENREIYTPYGDDIKKGVYISVNFYYESKIYDHTDTYYTEAQKWNMALTFIGLIVELSRGPQGKTDYYNYNNIRESYTFYVIEDSVDNITFNNMTTADTSEITEVTRPSSENEEEYKIQEEQYNNYLRALLDRITDTMYDGDCTTSGFRINVTDNEYLNINVNRNGEPYTLPNLKIVDDKLKVYEITDSGKYDITIKSYSKEKSLTLYVDNVTADEAYQRYFGEQIIYNDEVYGDEFLDYSPDNSFGNRRIIDLHSEVPVFIGSLTLNLQEQVDENNLPIYGTITNISTGNVTSVDSNQIVLTDLGEYEAVFYTNSDYYQYAVLGDSNIKMAGDVRTYKFRFKLVGKEADITINEQLLSTSAVKDLSIASPSDYSPKYYGVSRSTAGKGQVIIAFADKESALSYAKKVVWSQIQYFDNDGSPYWLTPNLENPAGGFVVSFSGWKNAEVVNKLAEKMVVERYFDLSKTGLYLTLENELADFVEEELSNLLNDLQLSEINETVIVWYNEAHRNQAIINETIIDDKEIIKFVGNQKYAVLKKDEEGAYSEIFENVKDYYFIKDSLGISSYTIMAEDQFGKQIALNYEEGLYSQFKNEFSSGLILITETNVYGIIQQYYVLFIEEGNQPATLHLASDSQQLEASQDNIRENQTFSKLTIKNISNYLDPNSYIRVKNNNTVIYYSIEEAIGLEFNESGEYSIAIIDRFGNYFEYKFSII